MKATCPSCGTRFEVETISDMPSFPFCTDRCRLVDLNKWFEGSYRMSREMTADDLANFDGSPGSLMDGGDHDDPD